MLKEPELCVLTWKQCLLFRAALNQGMKSPTSGGQINIDGPEQRSTDLTSKQDWPSCVLFLDQKKLSRLALPPDHGRLEYLKLVAAILNIFDPAHHTPHTVLPYKRGLVNLLIGKVERPGRCVAQSSVGLGHITPDYAFPHLVISHLNSNLQTSHLSQQSSVKSGVFSKETITVIS